MQEDVANFIRGFIFYCTNKPSNMKWGLYHPLPVPSHPCESITIDFVGGLPTIKKGHDYLLWLVDKFNKMCIFITCKKSIKEKEAAKLFFKHVRVYFGITRSIISDRDQIS